MDVCHDKCVRYTAQVIISGVLSVFPVVCVTCTPNVIYRQPTLAVANEIFGKLMCPNENIIVQLQINSNSSRNLYVCVK